MLYRKLLRNVPIKQKRSARMRPDACGICLLKQTASGAQSVTSPSKTEGFREFEADLSALFQKRSARMRPDACGICLLKQTASGAQSVTSPSKTEGFREFEADLSALFMQINMIDVIM